MAASGDALSWRTRWSRGATIGRLGRYRLSAIVLFGLNREVHRIVEESKAKVKALYVVSLNERATEEILAAPPSTPTGLFVRTIQDESWLVLACASWIADWLRKNLRADAELLLGGVNRTIFHPVVVKRETGPIIMSSGDKREREGSVAVKDAVGILRGRGYADARWETYFKQGLPQSGMAAKIRSAHVWLDGQWYAGWANAVIEAMACRVPVVCTDIGGVRDFAIHEETALLVPVEDREAMADAVQRMLEDDGLRQRLVANAYLKSLTFSYADMAARLEELICQRL